MSPARGPGTATVPRMDRRQFLQPRHHRRHRCGRAPGTDRGAQSAEPGESPYGALATEPDENGLRLPEGFTSRILAVGGEPVGDTGYAWHAFPDGAATFPTDDGGWIYVVQQRDHRRSSRTTRAA